MKKAASARGLFRATGKTSKPVVVREADGTLARVDQLPRERHDFYATPPAPTLAFMAVEGARIRTYGDTIWEPAAGNGAMVRIFRDHGFRVIASDLIDRGCGADLRSFFDFSVAPADAIVTNPPFNLVNWRDGKGAWIRHARRALGVPYMALLLPWPWPGAGGLAGLWAEDPPARVYLMRWKIDFTGQGAPPALNAWFVWDGNTRTDDVRLRMLDRLDGRQAEMFDGGEV